MKTLFYSITILISTFLFSASAKSEALIDFETGVVFTGYNDVRIPGDEGSKFSLKDNLIPEEAFFYRLRLDYTIASRHTISLLYAPLEIRSEGSLSRDILFQGTEFLANTELEGTYKFNSYRLTYRYDLVKNPGLEFGLGFTAKIRDARIGISSNELSSEKTNVGFVPIINFRLLWNINEKFGLLLYGDALASTQGRAEDVLLAATYNITDKLGIRSGYRILEGGADNDEVYNFSLINYVSFGISYTFL